MTQDEITRMAREAGLQPYYDEQVTAIARFAAIVAATEREKCTNTQEFVPLPREVVEQAIEALFCTDSEEGSTAYKNELEAVKKLRAALDQTQANQPAMTPIAQRKLDSLLTEGYTISGYSIYHEQKHQHGFVTGAGLVGWWRPEGMEYPQPRCEQPLRYLDGGSRYKVTHLKTSGYCIIGLPEELLGRWVALVDATDNKHMDSHQQPPTTEQSSAVQQPQGEQELVAEVTVSHVLPDLEGRCTAEIASRERLPVGAELFIHPQNLRCKSTQARLATLWGYVKEQSKRKPLTDEQLAELTKDGYYDSLLWSGVKRFARAIEAAHNIK